MNSGDYKTLITIEKPTNTTQSNASYLQTFTPFTTAWAAVEQLSGREMVEAGGVEGVYTHRVRMRYFPGITPDMRIKYTDYSTDPPTPHCLGIITGRNPELKNRELQIPCEEKSFEQP